MGQKLLLAPLISHTKKQYRESATPRLTIRAISGVMWACVASSGRSRSTIDQPREASGTPRLIRTHPGQKLLLAPVNSQTSSTMRPMPAQVTVAIANRWRSLGGGVPSPDAVGSGIVVGATPDPPPPSRSSAAQHDSDSS